MAVFHATTMTPPAESFGQRVRRLRREHHWNQAGLGRKVGISHQLVSDIERGKKHASVPTMLAISALLDVCPAYLYSGKACDGGAE